MNLDRGDYIVGMATTPKDAKKAEAEAEKAKAKAGVEATATDETIPVKGSLILSVTENGFGKRTPADEYRLQGRGGSGVINVKTTERNGKVVGIAQVTEESEVMLISHYGKIIRMDSSTIRESGRAAQGVRLLQLEPGDRVAAVVEIPLDEENGNGSGTLIQ
jgi:DNA gyrase subunit A